MKTTFSRLFSMIAGLLMLCLLITGVAFRFLMMSWVESEKRKSLSADASALADLAEAYDSSGALESNWNFQIGLSLFSEVGEVGARVSAVQVAVLQTGESGSCPGEVAVSQGRVPSRLPDRGASPYRLWPKHHADCLRCRPSAMPV